MRKNPNIETLGLHPTSHLTKQKLFTTSDAAPPPRRLHLDLNWISVTRWGERVRSSLVIEKQPCRVISPLICTTAANGIHLQRRERAINQPRHQDGVPAYWCCNTGTTDDAPRSYKRSTSKTLIHPAHMVGEKQQANELQQHITHLKD